MNNTKKTKALNNIPIHAANISLRDWFAGMALQGIAASVCTEEIRDGMLEAAAIAGNSIAGQYAAMAYITADAMLAERERRRE